MSQCSCRRQPLCLSSGKAHASAAAKHVAAHGIGAKLGVVPQITDRCGNLSYSEGGKFARLSALETVYSLSNSAAKTAASSPVSAEVRYS